MNLGSPSNYDNHYDEITTKLTALANFKNAGSPEYSPNLFSEDWSKNKNYDWEKYLSGLLDRATNCLTIFEKYLTLPFVGGKEDPFFENDSISMEQIGATSELEYEEIFKKWDFAYSNLERVNKCILSIRECIYYFEENKNVAPYSEKFLLKERIPFWGNQDEFALMIHLLISADFILSKKNGARKFKSKYSFKLLRDFENYSSRKKKELTTLFCQYFIGISIENNEIIEKEFSIETIDGRLNDSRLSELSTNFFIDRYETLLNHFTKIKQSKETKSHASADAKHEQK